VRSSIQLIDNPQNQINRIMEAEASTEFQDWELLHNPDSDLINSPKSDDSCLLGFQAVEAESECMNMIRPDYFSIDNQSVYANKTIPVADMSEEEGSVESGNPSWIDPGSDSGSHRSNDCKFSDFDAERDEGLVANAESEAGIGGIEDKSEKGIEFSEFDENSELGFVDNKKSYEGCEGFGEIHAKHEDLGKFWSEFGDTGLEFTDIGKETEECFTDHINEGDESNIFTENDGQDVSVVELEAGDVQSSGSESAVVEEMKLKGQPDGDEMKNVVWWKVPFEVMKYCLFKVSPVWTISMAAALMGIVILGRRLQKMKRKAHSLELKLAIDDKKVSQFMSRAARLNEAFSVVRRVPMVRPPLPVAGLNPWPVMSLR
jgi:hypothetical protein